LNEQELRAGLAYVQTCLGDIHTRADGRALTDDEQRSWDEGKAYIAETRRTLARYDEARDLAAKPGHVERATPPQQAPNFIPSNDPFAALEDRSLYGRNLERALVDGNIRAMEGKALDGDSEAHFERLLKRHAKGDSRWAHNILARQRPEYASGFAKLVTGQDATLDPEERAAMTVGTNTAGGFLVPTYLDPTLMLTNAGSSNIMRQYARVVTMTDGNAWVGVTTAGVTASWDAELTEVSDDTSAVAKVSIALNKPQAFIQASIEAFEDITGLTSDVLMLFGDAKDRLEGAAHMTGLGSSNQPKGLFTAINASASLQVVSTTAAVLGEVDIHALYRALPVRWRNRASFVANPLYTLAVKRLGTAVSSSYSGDLTMPVAERWLGRGVVESDDAPTTQTTTALDQEIAFLPLDEYVIVDKPGSASIEFIPHLFATANNLPDGRRGWYMHWRTGGDMPNVAAGRILCDKTSA
jgi:HK97 family phage major capsid protein